MSDDPVLDGRTRDEILAWTKDVAPHYVDGWNPDRDDVGTVLLKIFSDITEDVVEHLDRVPEKQRAVFLDAIDFEMNPPQPARVPVTFQTGDGATETVPVPAGTAVRADSTDDRDEQVFETAGDQRFVATPASLTDVYGVDPGTDRIVDHGPGIESGEPTELFAGENIQSHVFYMGHGNLFNLNPGATIELEFETNVPERVLREHLVWEFYGEPDDDDGEEGWHALDVDAPRFGTRRQVSQYQETEEFLDRLESFLGSHGYERTAEGDADVLLRSVADDVSKGRFESPTEEDDEGATLPPNLLEPVGVDDGLVRRIQRRLVSLRRRLRSAADDDFGSTFEAHTLRIGIPGEITEHEIDGVESRWIRCRLPEEELAPALFNVLVASVRVSTGSDTDSDDEDDESLLPPDHVANRNATMELYRGPNYLFGQNPQGMASFSLACEEAFTKPGAKVAISFMSPNGRDVTGREDVNPRVVWEYWSENGWSRLSAAKDGTYHLQSDGTVAFNVPSDMEETTVAGEEGYWIRGRLVSGSYGQPTMQETDSGSWEQKTDHISPPRYSNVVVRYWRSSVPLEHQITENNGSYEHVPDDRADFRPFKSPPGDGQGLYLGFDGPIQGGPIQLYVPMEESVYPHEFNPWTDMEYCADPRRGVWERLDFRDGTTDLTERGILGFSVPEQTTEFELFGKERHWVRVRVTGDEFVRSHATVFDERNGTVDEGGHNELSSESIAARERSERTRTPPVVTGLHVNTAWAENVETVDEETLGSGQGSANQTVSFDQTPVLEADVWVDESQSLTERERKRLRENDDVDTRTDRMDDGSLLAFWVRWEERDDFFDSEATSRHYVLDRISGTVSFGDGQQGATPPDGENNIRAEYRTGGGEDGNVERGAVSDLEDNVRLIDEVTNPTAGEMGQDRESDEEFVERAPKQLRDRDKAINRDGFERIAQSAAREIDKVRCTAGQDETGAIGHVTVLIVPGLDEPKPVPSEELIKEVESEMQDKAPVEVVESGSNLTVRGPNYVEVSVSATIETTGNRSTTDVQVAATETLTEFLHPLTGGPDGDGWDIGAVPPPTTFGGRLERLDGVTRIKNISVTYAEADDEVTLAGGEGAPVVPGDVLVYSGRHDITVDVRRRA